MARATRIYLVYECVHYDECVSAAFTVKHETIAWLKQQTPERRRNMSVTSVPDGREAEGNATRWTAEGFIHL